LARLKSGIERVTAPDITTVGSFCLFFKDERTGIVPIAH
jgi:hypothetical protein